MSEQILQEIAKIARDLEAARPVLGDLVRRLSRRVTARQDERVAEELRKYLLEIPDVDPRKIPAALRAFGQALQPRELFGTRQAPTKIARLSTSGSLEDEDAELRVKILFEVGLIEPVNRAITIAAGSDHNVRPGSKLPPKLATETAKFLGERAQQDLGIAFFKSLTQRNPEVVQALKIAFGNSQLRITNQVMPEIDASGGMFGASAHVTANATLELAPG